MSGTLDVAGDAVLEFGGGSVATIASGATLTINGPHAFVADTGVPGSNSALEGLTENAGTLNLQNGAFPAVGGSLDNSGGINVDNGSGSGSGLTIVGTLINMGFLGIGNGALTAPDTVMVGGLVNSDQIVITGNTNTGDAATLDVGSTAGIDEPGVLNGNINLSGDALLEFAGGPITTIAGRGELSIDGPRAFVADLVDTTSNSALTALSDNAGTFDLLDGASLSIGGTLNNTGTITVASTSNGSSSGTVSIAGTLVNDGTLNVGNSSLTASDTISAGGLLNSGSIVISGNASFQATLDVQAPAGFGETGVLTGRVTLGGDALLEFASGGISTIAGGGALVIDSDQAFVAHTGSLGSNSALTALSTNDGTVDLGGGTILSLGGGLLNANTINIDDFSGNLGSGSGLAVADTLINTGVLDIGDDNLTAPDTVTVAALINSGSIAIAGDATAGGALVVHSAAGLGAPGLLTGNINLSGYALLQFDSGLITTIAKNAELVLNSPHAFVAYAGSTNSNSALTGLSDNAGVLDIGDGSSIATAGDLANAGTLNIDGFGDDAGDGSGLSVVGTLTNTGSLNIGDNSLTAADAVTAAALVNTGTVTISGNASSGTPATLTVNGAASNADNLSIDAAGELNVTGGHVFTQTAGTATVSGIFAATTIALVGGTIVGTGTIDGDVGNTGGIIFGGTSSPGTLTVDGNYTQGGAGLFEALVTGTASNQIGSVHVSGDVDLQDGILDFNFGNFTPALGDSFTLMTFAPGGLTGTFGSTEDGHFVGDGNSVNIGNGLSLSIIYDDAAGTITADVVSATSADSWTGANANWTSTGDWSTGAVPGSSDDAVLGGTAGYTVSITAPITATADLDISDTNATLSNSGHRHRADGRRPDQCRPGQYRYFRQRRQRGHGRRHAAKRRQLQHREYRNHVVGELNRRRPREPVVNE